MFTRSNFLTTFLLIVSCSSFAAVDLLKVEKSKNKMYLLAGDQVIKEYDIALGGNPKGHKEKESDERTP